MSGIPRLMVLILFLGMLASLGSALFYLSRNTPESSQKLSRAFMVRIALSIAVFLLLMIAWYAGLITPHGPGFGPPAQ